MGLVGCNERNRGRRDRRRKSVRQARKMIDWLIMVDYGEYCIIPAAWAGNPRNAVSETLDSLPSAIWCNLKLKLELCLVSSYSYSYVPVDIYLLTPHLIPLDLTRLNSTIFCLSFSIDDYLLIKKQEPDSWITSWTRTFLLYNYILTITRVYERHSWEQNPEARHLSKYTLAVRNNQIFYHCISALFS